MPERVDNRRALVCALALCAGFINLALALAHLGVHTGYAVILLALGAGQVLWAVALYRWRSRRLLIVGALVNVAVALWFGVPSGALLARPLDLIASSDELALALCALAAGSTGRARGRVSATLRALTTTTGLLFVLVSSIVLAAPQGHAHGRGSVAGLQYGDLSFFCPLGQHRLHQ